jgi:hypothetical protein
MNQRLRCATHDREACRGHRRLIRGPKRKELRIIGLQVRALQGASSW